MSPLEPFLHTPRVAYFSMEIALESAIPTYAGGLGVLAGDTVRAGIAAAPAGVEPDRATGLSRRAPAIFPPTTAPTPASAPTAIIATAYSHPPAIRTGSASIWPKAKPCASMSMAAKIWARSVIR